MKFCRAAVIFVLCAAAVAACAPVAHRSTGTGAPRSTATAADDVASSLVQISVTHLARGSWRVEYQLPIYVEQLRFSRAMTTFRRTGWHVETPGLRLVSGDSAEYIEATDGRAFRQVAIRFPSEPTKHEREYVLTPAFTDGSEGLYTGLLYVDLVQRGQRSRSTVPEMRFVPVAGDRVVLRGIMSERPVAWRDERGAGTYVYFGVLEPVVTERVIAIVDPGLPSHLRTMFEERLPVLTDYFTEKLGYSLAGRPLILIGYVPTEGSNLSSHGDVLPGVIRFGFDGVGWARDDAELRRRAFYLIAHEAAHLWNGELFESSENRRSAWLHEGAADAFAWLAMRDFGVLSESELRETVEDAMNVCLFVTRGHAWGAVMDRANVPYACGATMQMMAAVAGAEHGGLFELWRRVFADAEQADRRYTPTAWLTHLRAVAGTRLVDYFASALSEPQANPAAALAAQLEHLSARVQLGAWPERGSVPQRLARRAMTVLMQSDCGGAFSFSDDDAGFRLAALPQCGTFPREGSTVIALQGHRLSGEAGAAYAAVASRCERKEEVTITVAGNTPPVTVRCTEALPPYVQLAAWPTLEAAGRSP